jgi:hypothetical protein
MGSRFLLVLQRIFRCLFGESFGGPSSAKPHKTLKIGTPLRIQGVVGLVELVPPKKGL